MSARNRALHKGGLTATRRNPIDPNVSLVAGRVTYSNFR
jgi:hypothetical protein